MPRNRHHAESNLAHYARAVRIDRALREGRPLGRVALAERAGVDKRSISRTIDWMRDVLGLEVPYVHEPGVRGYRYPEGTDLLPALLVEVDGVPIVCSPVE